MLGWWQSLRRPLKPAQGRAGGKEKGMTILETAIALALLGIVGVFIFSGLATTSRAVFIARERTTALSLAQSQTEYVNSLDYSAEYSPSPIPPGEDYAAYAASITSVPLDGGIQKITVAIRHHDRPVITLESYKLQ